MRIIFAGTPDFAATALTRLLDSSHQLVAVLTQPDRPAGRGKKLTTSPVKQAALEAGVPVLQPTSLKDAEVQQLLAQLQADVMVVVAYGLIIPQAVLDLPPLGCLNIHASLLPRWRGAAPIQRALAAGDSETGVTIMQMDAGLDTGAMLMKATTPIDAADTGGSLHDRLAILGSDAIITTLDRLPFKGDAQQDADSCYAAKLSKQEATIDWRLGACQLHNQVRAFNPWPVAHTQLADQNIRIWKTALVQEQMQGQGRAGEILATNSAGITVATGDGALLLQELQLPGKKRQSAASLLNGHAELFNIGKVFL